MKTKHSFRFLFSAIVMLPSAVLLAGCDGGVPAADVESSAAAIDDNSDSQKRHPDMAHSPADMSHGSTDMSHGGTDLGTLPSPNPPPTSCDQRSAGVTGIQVVVRIDQYQGLITGSNGVHEIAYGTIIGTPWVYDSKVVDTSNVELAMNVASAKDSSGLPKEIKLAVGQVLEVEGEYIPASKAGAHDAHGAAAVLHFSHSPCGYVNIAGTVYK